MNPNFAHYLFVDFLLNPQFKTDRSRARAIAKIANIPEGTAQTRISRARKKLSEGGLSRQTLMGLPLQPDGYFVYCIECNMPNHFYVGQTAYLEERIKKHFTNRGAVFTRKHGAKQWFLVTKTNSRHDALKLEVLLWQVLKHKGVIAGGY